MTLSSKGVDFITKEEGGIYTHAYRDQAGIPTIGIGTIRYEDGSRVKMGDVITKDRAIQLFNKEKREKEEAVLALVKGLALNQNQLDSLISFAYNVGTGALAGSTLLKRIKANPCDPSIRDAFLMWTKITVDGKKVESTGLRLRRQREADLYFSKEL